MFIYCLSNDVNNNSRQSSSFCHSVSHSVNNQGDKLYFGGGTKLMIEAGKINRLHDVFLETLNH